MSCFLWFGSRLCPFLQLIVVVVLRAVVGYDHQKLTVSSFGDSDNDGGSGSGSGSGNGGGGGGGNGNGRGGPAVELVASPALFPSTPP